MLEYEFEEVSCGEVYGFYLRETAAHREVILRRAADDAARRQQRLQQGPQRGAV